MKRLLILLILLSGCVGRGGGSRGDGEVLYAPRYAQGFTLRADGLRLNSPWGERLVALERPLERIVCMSASHVAFIDALGCADRIVGISGTRYITSPNVAQVPDVGYEGNLNYELIARLKPDAMLVYSVAGERLPLLDKLEEMGIPVVLIGEYLETTPLGKAEWIVAFGQMLGRRTRAEELFEAIRDDYVAAQQLAASVEARPKVMLNAPWRGTWFVPGDESYMVGLLYDAGAEYVCAGVAGAQSRAIDGETAWLAANDSDYWINPNEATSIEELLAANPQLAEVPPVKSRRVYNNNLRSTPGGGSDFWESGAVHPERVLRDLIFIFHPELLPEYELYYYRRLE